MARVAAASKLYLAEVYAPRATPEALEAESERIRVATEALARSGVDVQYLRSLLVPGEETAFHFFEADGLERVEQVLRAAGLEAEQISLAVPVSDTRGVALSTEASGTEVRAASGREEI
jgi:hypothetical protein